MAYQPYSDNVAIGTKKRRHVEKTSQNTANIYANNKGKSYKTGDSTLKKTRGYDSLTGTTQEKRGRKSAGESGNVQHKQKTSGQKQRQKGAIKRNKAKGGGKK